MEKTWTKDEIKEMLRTRNEAVERGIIRIYELQTPDEQGAGVAFYDNKVGFSGAHAEFCTSLAEQLKKGRHLSARQMSIARNIITHYAGQLTMVANHKMLPPKLF
jgi:hypothetical protein